MVQNTFAKQKLFFSLIFVASLSLLNAANVLDINPNKEVVLEASFPKGAINPIGSVQVTNLNKNISSWYLVRLVGQSGRRGGAPTYNINIENPDPSKVKVHFQKDFPNGLFVDGKAYDLWGNPMSGALITAYIKAKSDQISYTGICDGKLYIRVQVAPGGEDMTSMGSRYAPQWMIDRAKASAAEEDKIAGTDVDAAEKNDTNVDQSKWPRRGNIVAGTKSIQTSQLKIKVKNANNNTYIPGNWYEAQNFPGAYVSVIRPSQVITPKGSVNSSSVAFLVAMDLDELSMGWTQGSIKDAEYEEGWGVYDGTRNSPAGPDGFSSVNPPLEKTGAVNPFYAPKYFASFNGGFRRRDAFLRAGTLGKEPSVYGYIENSAVMTTLSKGLATAYVTQDGKVDIKTWEEKDNANILPDIRHARQNGLPLIDIDSSGNAVRGKYLFDLKGNWGGWWHRAMTSNFPTSRSGMCIQEYNGKRFLIYGYFSQAYQWDLADVFLAYGCKAGMQLDMYKAKFSSFYLAKLKPGTNEAPWQGFHIEPIIADMEAYIKTDDGGWKNPPHTSSFFRDFFYIYRKD